MGPRRKRRIFLRLVPIFTSIFIIFMFFGCHSYPWMVFKWNCLQGTPYLKAKNHPEPKNWPAEKVTVTWLGHATVLINLHGTNILTDPLLMKRMGPPHLGGHVNLGIRRISELPLKPEELPRIDLVLLSHTHADHWDAASLKYFGAETTAIIPVGTAKQLPEKSFGKRVELSWGEETHVGAVRVKAFRTEHWGRPNGYLVESKGVRIAFFGDTANQDRNEWPSAPAVDWRARLPELPDICILPIGAYTYPYNHLSPEEAWSTFSQVRGRYLLPIHWRTFILAPPEREPPLAPLERLRTCAGTDFTKVICTEPGQEFTLRE